MNAKRSLIVLLTVTLTGALLTAGQGLSMATSDAIEPWTCCNPAGSYYGNHPVEPVAAAVTIIPNDPECRSISCIQKIFYMDHTLGGMFPEVVTASDTVGMGVRTGPSTWHMTLIRHATDGGAGLQYMALITGDFEFPNDGRGLERRCTWALYLPEQDKDGDGWPDADEAPLICIPDEGLMPRMKILPKCEVMPLSTPEQ